MKRILTIALMFAAGAAFSQQEIMISQYMFNGLFINPAYAGTHEYVTSSLLHRNQWVNFNGAPKSSLVSVDGALPGKNMGLGFVVANDRIGATEQTDVFANFAYQVKLGPGKLSFGLKGGGSNYVLHGDQLTVWDKNDEVFAGTRTAFLPKLGTGLYYYTNKWYAGISIPTLLAYDPQHNFSFDVSSASASTRHYLINGGYVFVLNDNFKLKPSTLIKYEPSAPLQADINLNLLYMDQFWIGASYRTGDAVVFMVEYQTNTRFRVGYAYDYTLSNLQQYAGGTHEIMIGYDFGRNLTKIKTPRYF
ncbi:MAG: type IX secretion system membrane protein PorP/SprF [bacterium]|nr:type IX secretion system membrane protein PorP/SprF [bacterium]